MKHQKTSKSAEAAEMEREQAAEAVAEADPALEELAAQLQEAAGQRDEYLQMAQRVQADFENYKRRNASIRKEAYDDGAAAFIKTILPVCDNLERALDVESQDGALKDGVKLVQKQLLEALEKRGVIAIDRVGEAFDPKLEDAVVQAGTEEGEPGTVAQVLLKGYRMGEQVLRHAMVKVVAG